MPTPEHYLSGDDDHAKLRAAYLAYLEKTLASSGLADPATAAARILAFETAIAEVRWSPVQLRDREANYNPMTPDELAAYAPQFAWERYLAANGIENVERIVVGTDTAVRDTAQIISHTALDTLKDWMRFGLIDRFAPLLGEAHRARHFAFHGTAMRGAEEPSSMRSDALVAIQQDLTRDLGRVYATRFVSPAEKESMEEVVANIKAAFDPYFARAQWLDEAERATAREKLARVGVNVGYPDVYRDFSKLRIEAGDPVGNRLRLGRHELARQVAIADKPLPQGEWVWGAAHLFDAANTAQLNLITMPSGMMREFVPEDATLAQLYAKAGHVIAHEIGHGFDDQGSRFRPDGRLDSWWSEETRARYDAEAAKLVAQLSATEVLPGVTLPGDQMIGEALADLIGAHMALAGYRAHCAKAGADACPATDMERDGAFFIAMAQGSGSLPDEAAIRRSVAAGYHPPRPWRLHSILRNMDAWYAAFEVKPGDDLYLAPEDRVRLFQ